MIGKLHEQSREPCILPLQLDKAEVAKHGHILYLDHAESACRQFLADGTDRHDSHAIGVFKKELDAFGTTQVHQYME